LLSKSAHVLITFAHGTADYLFEEQLTTSNAWGPFNNNITYWLYWDLNLLTGIRTFGSTSLLPITSDTMPSDPEVDQHWFNLKDIRTSHYDDHLDVTITKTLHANCMYVWDGELWIEKIRLFAGTYYNGGVSANLLSSQVGLYTSCDAGFITYDEYNNPAQSITSDDTYRFLTSTSQFDQTHVVSTTVSFQSTFEYSVAAEDLPKHSIVAYSLDNTLVLATYNDPLCAGVGVVEYDVNSGSETVCVTNVYVTDPSWNFTVDPSTPIYLGLDGAFQLDPPTSGIIQQVGYVISSDTVYIDTTWPVVNHAGPGAGDLVPLTVSQDTGKFYTQFIQSADEVAYIRYSVYFNVYEQHIPARNWLIKHNANLPNVYIQLQDSLGLVMEAQSIQLQDTSTVVVRFKNKTIGKAILFLY
jgi:hypothetical protein